MYVMKYLKYIISFIITWILSYNIIFFEWVVLAAPPSFEANYVDYVMGRKWENRTENLWDLGRIGIDKNKNLKDNIKNIFYPDNMWQGWKLWDIIKTIGFIVFVAMLVFQGLQYVAHSDQEDKVWELHKNFLYIFLWWLLFFWATRILWIWLNLGWGWGSETLMNNLDKSIMFQIFAWLRALAFFIAIILLIFTWWKIMVAMEQEDKFKIASRGLLNIIVPLVLIKIIDYIYFIAQTPDFKSKATEIIIEVSKVLWYILWAFFTIMIIYYWFRLMFGWNDEQLKKVKNIIVAVFLWSLVIFIFFLIIYQIAQEFAG